MSIDTWHGSQGRHEHPVSDATLLSSALFVRVPEVNALQDPQLDDIEGGIREPMIRTRIRQQTRRGALVGFAIVASYRGSDAAIGTV